jgi:type IV pilus assembly protein PilB
MNTRGVRALPVRFAMHTGEIFVQEGLITPEQLEHALQVQRESGGSDTIARVLVKLGAISDKDRLRCMGKMWGVPFADLSERPPSPEAAMLIPGRIARKLKSIPVSLSDGSLHLAMANPLDVFAIDEVRSIVEMDVEPMIASEEEISACIEAMYKADADVHTALKGVISQFEDDILVTDAGGDEDVSVDELREMGEEAPVVRLANLIITQAIADGASDIHVEPHANGVKVRYRIDGVLTDAMNLPKKLFPPLSSRLKIMADMDIAEKRIPQDNRIGAVIGGREFDFRVSTLPLIHGEKIVLRVLDKQSISIGLEKLGFLDDTLGLLRRLCSHTFGILLVTGPTGSGKSTTLYSILNQVNTGLTNISTIEDPVEYELPGVNQCGVNIRAGMTFAAGLRALLRQDPDIIMVGEMRDTETATIAMEAALTGHLVFSTLHTNDAPSAPNRLLDMGVEPFLIASSIIGVLAQRLVRVVCRKCAEEYEESLDAFRRYGFEIPEEVVRESGGKVTLKRGKGCDYCKGTGYKGRTGVHELMELTDELRDMVLKKEPSHKLRILAEQRGMRNLKDDAVTKVLRGTTTLDEVVRVIYSG